MRRVQSVRTYAARPSLALAADDLGVLREGDETNEDVLRRQLLEKDRECDRLQMSIQALQDQLLQRPSLEVVQKVQKDYKDLELLLQGTQRENEKCMADMERMKTREKMLERELTRLAGDNWQANLEIPPATMSLRTSSGIHGGLNLMHQRSNTISSPLSHMTRSYSPSSSPRPSSSSGFRPTSGSPTPYQQNSTSQAQSEQQQQDNAENQAEKEAQRQAALAQIEQVRMLILGMDKKLDMREEKLSKMVDRAESESKKFEATLVEAKTAGVGLV
ncbi:hypothetical protein D9613_004415 [Agrocybe pediades]|uniref:Uncharacterized protein n=1 Tax=Agrocybe pediades TaxID=84607 RepID=A0A8H4QJY9_9AGAR|nr:hypothetical protein D9613_004415 [Agrocybe pediades]KAF9562260.1 hypothetical protein CPC08DRAFT_817208 [Agrocybe pediades]